ncbi:MAG: FecR domain-containing protein [Desulfobacterales bacterium]|nr:FecR domain-containing protein [Desulfobacterales bacterium]
MKRIVSLMILLTVCWVLPAVALAAEPVGSVTFVKGKADITRPGQDAEPLVKGDDIYVGDIVRTKTNAKVEITFIDESIVRVAQKSRLQITEYMFEQEERRSTLSLFRGKIQSLVKKVAGFSFGQARKNRFEIRTPTAVCGVRGTDFFTWFMNGQTGTAFKEGQGYIYPANNPALSRNINTNEAGYVDDPDAAPVVKPATDADLEQHLEDTMPTEGEEGGDGGDDPGAGLTMDGGDTGDTGGTGGTDGIGGFVTDDKIILDLRDTAADTITGITLFSGEAAVGFLSGGWLAGEIEDDTNQGSMTLTGTSSWEIYPGETTLGMVGGSLTSPDDTEVGAFDGQIAGVGGSWRGLLVSLYAQEPAEPAGSLYDVGYLYGALSSSQDLSTYGVAFSAGGKGYRSNPQGQVSLTIPEEGTLHDALENKIGSSGPSNIPAPGIGGTIEAGKPVFGSAGGTLATLATDSGRVLGIGSKDSYPTYSYTGNESWTSIYGYSDSAHYFLGSVDGTDDLANHLAYSGNLTYMDYNYLGNVNIWSRGTVGEGVGIVSASAVTLDPLAYSGYWAGDSVYANSEGAVTPIAYDYGLMGGRTFSELVVYGQFSSETAFAPNEKYLYNTDFYLDGDTVNANGVSAGFWKMQDASAYGPNQINYGMINGEAVALFRDPATNEIGIMASKDMAGRFYPKVGIVEGPTYSNIEMFNLVGSWVRSSPEDGTAYPYLSGYSYISKASLVGDFNGSGSIAGGLDYGYTSYFYGEGGSPGWGIYNLKLGAGTDNVADRPTGETAWSAKLGGQADFGAGSLGYFLADVNGTWAEEEHAEITGTVLGTYLSDTHLGQLTGSYYGTSTGGEIDPWIGQSIGIFEPTQGLDYSGFWSASGTLYDASSTPGEITIAGSDAGIIGFVKGSGFSYWAMGDFIDNLGSADSVPYMQNSEIFATAVNPDTTGGGLGLLKGYSAGIALPPSGSSAGQMLSRMELIYFDHTGDMGFAYGDMNAETYPELAAWSGQGELTSQSMLPAGEGHDPNDLTYYTSGPTVFGLKGDFSGIGTIQAGVFTADFAYLYDIDQMRSVPFGVYHFSVESAATDFTGKPAGDSPWTAAVGGSVSMDSAGSVYSLGEVGGTWSGGGFIDGLLSGWYVTPIQMGTLSGEFSGLFETDVSSGGWIGQSVGRYTGDRLDYQAATPNSVFSWNDGVGMIENGGSLVGFIGLLDSATGNINLLGVGEYDLTGYSGGGFFWNASVESGAYDNRPGKADMTLKDGKIGGFIAGAGLEPFAGEYHSAGVGRAELVYFNENGNAGFSSGGVDADMFALDSTSGLWKLEGSLPPVQKNIALIPSENLENTYFMIENPLSAYMAGEFDGSGSISGLYANGGGVSYIKDLAAGRSLPFGTYLSLMQAPESIYHGYTGAPAEDSGFSATIGGTGVFDGSGTPHYWLASVYGEFISDDQRIEGALGTSAAHEDAFGYYVTPIQMGRISGNLEGFFSPSGEDYGNWLAQSIGRFEGERVDFSGDWGSYPSTLYYNDTGHTFSAGEEWGRFGIKGEEFLAVGKFYDDDLLAGKKMLWNSYLGGDQLLNETGVDDEFGIGTIASGFTAGLWTRAEETASSGLMNGDGWFLVLDNDGNGKIMRADLTGRFFDMPVTGVENGMWYAKSDSVQTLPPQVAEQYKTGISGATAVLRNIGVGAMTGSFAEDGFSGFGGDILPDSEVLFLTHSTKGDLPWGVYNMKLGAGGMFTRRPEGNASWSGVIAGGDAFFDDGSGDGGIFVASADGTWNDAGEIVGKIGTESTAAGAFGKYMTSYQVGGFSDIGGGIGGDFTGINSSEGTWIGQSVGMFSGSLLSLSGRFDGQHPEIGYGGYLGLSSKGSLVDGLVGTTVDPSSSTPYYIIGHSIANTPITSVSTGVHLDSSGKEYLTLLDFYSEGAELKGYGVGLYADQPYPEVKTFGYTNFSDLSGTHYSKVPVFDAEGRITLGEAAYSYSVLTESPVYTNGLNIALSDVSKSFNGDIRGVRYSFASGAPGIHRTIGFGSEYRESEYPVDMYYWAMTSIGRYLDTEGIYYDGGGHAELWYLDIQEDVSGVQTGVLGRVGGEIYGSPISTLDLSGTPTEKNLLGWMDWGGYVGSLYHYGIEVGNDTGIFAGYKDESNQIQYMAMGEFVVNATYSVTSEEKLVWATNLNDGYDMQGFSGGIWSGGAMDGKAFAVIDGYDVSGMGSGILVADVLGNYNELYGGGGAPNSGGWLATGNTAWIQMADSIAEAELDPSQDPISGTGESYDPINGAVALQGSGELSSTNFIGLDELWGIWGTYLTSTPDQTSAPSDFSDWNLSFYRDSGDGTHIWFGIEGGRKPGEDRILEGRATGAWVDLDDVTTGVIGGPVKGTFDPATSVWQAVAGGAFMDTQKFLSMVQENPGALDQLLIPRFEVGRTDLAGTNANGMNVNINDMIFFSHSTGARPSIWATNSVNGSYSTTPAVNETVLLNGQGFSNVNFKVDQFGYTGSPDRWGATIDGAGTVPGTEHNVTIQGGAAGTFGSGSFSGTGAGVAQ